MASTACFLCSRRPAEENVPRPSPNFVHSSYTPDTACASQCALDLVAVNAAVRRCDEEIVILRNLLMCHQNTRKQLQERAAQYRSIMSPIRRLPKELLVKIFSHCILDYFRFGRYLGDEGVINDPSTLPIFTLLRVCSKWRSVILSTGALWAQFECKLDSAMHSGGIGLKCLEMHLERSGDAPLSFLVHGKALLPSHMLIRRLLQEKQRWMYVSFECKQISMQGWDIPPGSFPCLRRFDLASSTVIDEAQDATILIDFSTQSMRYLYISPRILMHAIFPFNNLTTLVISNYRSSALVAKCLFEGCTAKNLEELEIWQGRGSDDDDDDDEFDYGSLTSRMTLNIKALTIILTNNGSQGVILELLSACFCLPRLHSFKLTQRELLDTATLSATLNMTVGFLDTVDNLKSFSIYGIPLTDADVLQLLNKTPLLEEVLLTFVGEGSGPEVLKHLTLSPGAPFVKPALPLLRGVNFYFEHGDNPLIVALLDMLCSRLPCDAHSDAAELSEVPSLENIFIDFEDRSYSNDAARFIRYAASSAYILRWLDVQAFSLLKAGCKYRWTYAAGPAHPTI